MIAKMEPKRSAVRAIVYDRLQPLQHRFRAQMIMNRLPATVARTRAKNRCNLTGRSRSTYRKFGVSRIMIRDLQQEGRLVGWKNSSW